MVQPTPIPSPALAAYNELQEAIATLTRYDLRAIDKLEKAAGVEADHHEHKARRVELVGRLELATKSLAHELEQLAAAPAIAANANAETVRNPIVDDGALVAGHTREQLAALRDEIGLDGVALLRRPQAVSAPELPASLRARSLIDAAGALTPLGVAVRDLAP